MREEELKKLIANGESETVEFKESFSEGVMISLVAFANKSGGTVFVGENTTDKTPKRATARKTARKTAQNIVSGIRKEILDLLKKNPKYTKDDLKEILGKGDGTIKEHLSILKKEGHIKRVGGRKLGYWEIIENDK